jgi:hypothetical protein
MLIVDVACSQRRASVARQGEPSCRGKLPQRLVSRILPHTPFPPWTRGSRRTPPPAARLFRVTAVPLSRRERRRIRWTGMLPPPLGRPESSRDRAADIGNGWMRGAPAPWVPPSKNADGILPPFAPSTVPDVPRRLVPRQREQNAVRRCRIHGSLASPRAFRLLASPTPCPDPERFNLPRFFGGGASPGERRGRSPSQPWPPKPTLLFGTTRRL